MHIRPFHSDDADRVARLFHDTVRSVNSKDYSKAHIRAWAPDDIHFKDWKEHCRSRYTLVAEHRGMIAGFAQLEESGYIDCFYCHRDFQRKGGGSRLYEALERKAGELGLGRLHTESSITARPFFEALGFNIIRKQQVLVRGERLTNYVMEKRLDDT